MSEEHKRKRLQQFRERQSALTEAERAELASRLKEHEPENGVYCCHAFHRPA